MPLTIIRRVVDGAVAIPWLEVTRIDSRQTRIPGQEIRIQDWIARGGEATAVHFLRYHTHILGFGLVAKRLDGNVLDVVGTIGLGARRMWQGDIGRWTRRRRRRRDGRGSHVGGLGERVDG